MSKYEHQASPISVSTSRSRTVGKTMTHAAAARLLGVSVRTIYRRCREGLIREIPFGKWKRVKTADVELLAEKGFRSPKQES